MLKRTDWFLTIALLMLISPPALAGEAGLLPEPDPGMLALVGSAVTGVVLAAHRKFRDSQKLPE